MSGKMIENSERGITINKSLAWAMLIGLLSGGMYVGTLITDVSRSIEFLNEKISAQNEASMGRETRLRALERGATQSDERVANILALLSRIDGRLERIERSQEQGR